MLLKLVKLSISCAFINCFNLDTNNFEVYYEPRNKIKINDSSKSYFGYTVMISPGHGIFSDQRIIIGAPKASIMRSSTIVDSGIVYDCWILGCKPITLPRHLGQPKETWKGNFIGGSMDISYKYDRMTICGFRKVYKYNDLLNTDYKMMGACYWSNSNGTEFNTINLLAFDELGAIRSHSFLYYNFYGQGQAGFSAHFPEDRNELIVGAPGIFGWSGAPLRVRDKEYSKPRGRLTKPLNDIEIPKDKVSQDFDLLGYSVSSGYFQEENELLYVTSSPRGSFYMGKVLLFEFMKNKPIRVRETLKGHQFGEYFGASLSSGRINGDNLDELIVGAPFHKGNSFNEGRVYVYFGSEDNLKECTILEEKHLNGQFGSAVMFLGDLDNDGFGDIAVGAPYANEGSGVVYIYNGYKYGLRNIYSQKIKGKDIRASLRGFGISISRAIDMGGYESKDVAVGAHISGNAVLLWSYRAVIVEYNLLFHPAVLKHNSKSVSLKICFRFSIYNEHSLRIFYAVDVDKVLGRANIEGSNNGMVTKSLIIPRMTEACDSVTVSLNRLDNLNSPAISPRVTAILSYKIETYHSSFCPKCPVLDVLRSTETHKELVIPFSLDCGDDYDCRSRLILDIDIPELSNGEPYIIGSKPHLKLEANIKNQGENAYATKLEIVLPERVFVRQTPPICRSLNTSAIICSVADPLQKNRTKTFNLYLDVNYITKYLSSYVLPISARVITGSNNLNVDTFIYQLKVINEAHVTIYGKSEQKNNYFGSTNTEITHIYKIEKTNVSPLERIIVKINIPHYYITSTTKIPFVQLYEPKGSIGYQTTACHSNFTYISVGSVKTEDIQEATMSRRNNRQKVFPKISQIHQKEYINLNDNTFYVNCSINPVICSEISCTFDPFDDKILAVIEIKMILDISAIISSIGDTEAVIFSTRGDVDIDIPRNFTQSENRKDSFSISTILINEEPTNAYIAPWIIVLAVIAGLLLLSLLILTLVKVGFFERIYKQKLEDLKAVQEEPQYESIDYVLERLADEEVPERCIKSLSKEGRKEEVDHKYFLFSR